MDSRQFRVGNLVCWKNSGKEFQITLQSLYEGANLDWKPLLITKEILLRFGFEEVEIDNGNFVLIIQKNKGGGIGEYQIWVDLGIENETNEISISLVCDSEWLVTKNKYIHQLQNLYFALTQKELKLRNNIKVLIEDSDMSVRLINCLKNNVNFSCNKQVPVITYLDEISNYTKKEVYEIFGLRAKKMKELQEVMLRFDIEFKEE
jgi:hypothetical protein